MTAGTAITVRPAAPDDREGIIGLAVRALGWQGDERDRAFFAWKHDENPFGPSLAWVAEHADRIVGFRTFMRWEAECGESRLRLVRAVDTATDPEFQGRGIFRELTTTAVRVMTAEGIDAVFNTPNRQSGPGYLKMGWSTLGRPGIAVVPRTLSSLVRMAQARTASAKWSEPVSTGDPATTGLDGDALGHAPPPSGWVTPRSREYLAWRYGFGPLNYRVVPVRGGRCIFRVRRRGAALEVAVCEWLSPEPDPRSLRRLVARAGDYAVGIGLSFRRHGAFPLPGQGPEVMWRPLGRPGLPALGDLGFGLGELELF